MIWKYLADGPTGVLGGRGEIGGQFWYAPQADGSREQTLHPAILPHDDVARGAPAFLQIKEGQSLQEALAPYQEPNLQYFSEVNLPQYVARPAEDGAYGFSKLTPQGVVNTPPPAKAAGN